MTRRVLPRITVAWLKRHGASCGQVGEFAGEWPDGAEITAANIRRAAGLGLDLDWFASRILPATAWRAYEEARATAWRAYKEATAWRAYEEARATAWRAYKEATVAAERAYEEATAWRAYEEATATALIEALGLE